MTEHKQGTLINVRELIQDLMRIDTVISSMGNSNYKRCGYALIELDELITNVPDKISSKLDVYEYVRKDRVRDTICTKLLSEAVVGKYAE